MNEYHWKLLKSGRSGLCHISNKIIRKTYTNRCEERMSNELNALSILDKYEQFPKVVKVDWDHFIIYMTYVGRSIQEIPNKEIPHDVFEQLENIEHILKLENVHHNDLSISHLLINEGRLHLIDWEKVFIDRTDTLYPQYEINSFKDYYISDLSNKLGSYLLKKRSAGE